MTARLYAWLRGDCPAAASPWGWCLFQLGLLLLPSSVLLASLLFVPALVLGSLRRGGAYWSDRWNWPLLVAGGLMLLGCFSALRADLAWAGLNWVRLAWPVVGWELAHPLHRTVSNFTFLFWCLGPILEDQIGGFPRKS